MKPEDDEAVGTDQDDAEFDAAFAEAAGSSEAGEENTESGEVESGSADVSSDGQEEDFDQSFTDAAAGSAAASKGDIEDEDLAAKLAKTEAEIERLKQSERSQRGRVSALTKKLVEQRAAMKPPEDRKEGEGDESRSGNWEEFQREFPEMAAIVDERLKPVDSKIESVAQRVESVSATTDTIVDKEILEYKETQFSILAEKHPDYNIIKGAPEFEAWKANAPPEVAEKIKSKHAEDAISVLDTFKAETGWKSVASKPSTKSEVQKINERRAAVLSRSAGIPSKKVGHSAKQDTGSDDDDFDAAFAARASKIEKDRGARY